MGVKLSLAIGILSDIITWAILIRAIVSWLPLPEGNILSRVLNVITDPVVSPVRKLMEKIMRGPAMIDFSPVIAMIAVELIARALQMVCINLFL